MKYFARIYDVGCGFPKVSDFVEGHGFIWRIFFIDDVVLKAFSGRPPWVRAMVGPSDIDQGDSILPYPAQAEVLDTYTVRDWISCRWETFETSQADPQADALRIVKSWYSGKDIDWAVYDWEGNCEWSDIYSGDEEL